LYNKTVAINKNVIYNVLLKIEEIKMIDNELMFNKLPILSEDNKQCDKSDSIKKVEHWLLSHSAGYFAHAISDANADRVLQCG
jgi:hypothetical protein